MLSDSRLYTLLQSELKDKYVKCVMKINKELHNRIVLFHISTDNSTNYKLFRVRRYVEAKILILKSCRERRCV